MAKLITIRVCDPCFRQTAHEDETISYFDGLVTFVDRTRCLTCGRETELFTLQSRVRTLRTALRLAASSPDLAAAAEKLRRRRP